MTDLDIYFWRFFALGAGFAFMWRAYPWLSTMGRAARHWITVPDLARKMYDEIYGMMGTFSRAYPEWYRRYCAFRETAHL